MCINDFELDPINYEIKKYNRLRFSVETLRRNILFKVIGLDNKLIEKDSEYFSKKHIFFDELEKLYDLYYTILFITKQLDSGTINECFDNDDKINYENGFIHKLWSKNRDNIRTINYQRINQKEK